MAPALPPGRRWSFKTLRVLILRVPSSFCQLTREEVLWAARTEMEALHRVLIHRYGMLNYYPSARDVDRLPEMNIIDFCDTCNKSVPIYILPGDCYLPRIVLHNYVYRRWFRPYRSEIEHQRFLCKFITPQDLPNEYPPSHSTISTVVSLNRAICAEVEKTRRRFDKLLVSDRQAVPRSSMMMDETRFHILQPLFRAILILIPSQNYHHEDSGAIGRLPVLLVLTGVTDGLSAPITFDSIANNIEGYAEEKPETVKTTLKTAIDFVLDLEAREATALGLQPDPVASWKPSHCFYSNWQETQAGEPPAGPSSRFVDMEKFPEWSGGGQWYDSDYMVKLEQREFRMERARIAAESNILSPKSIEH
ncbi:hypothetical protein F4819DRAFT_505556 [Hypoxylon fuscum]|nr:hypothetical protein F4819DRAFT_505556 [Hypoxylon fuscum]